MTRLRFQINREEKTLFYIKDILLFKTFMCLYAHMNEFMCAMCVQIPAHASGGT